MPDRKLTNVDVVKLLNQAFNGALNLINAQNALAALLRNDVDAARMHLRKLPPEALGELATAAAMLSGLAMAGLAGAAATLSTLAATEPGRQS